MTIREALKLSINTIAAQVGAEVGPAKIVDLGKRFGISSKLRTTCLLYTSDAADEGFEG